MKLQSIFKNFSLGPNENVLVDSTSSIKQVLRIGTGDFGIHTAVVLTAGKPIITKYYEDAYKAKLEGQGWDEAFITKHIASLESPPSAYVGVEGTEPFVTFGAHRRAGGPSQFVRTVWSRPELAKLIRAAGRSNAIGISSSSYDFVAWKAHMKRVLALACGYDEAELVPIVDHNFYNETGTVANNRGLSECFSPLVGKDEFAIGFGKYTYADLKIADGTTASRKVAAWWKVKRDSRCAGLSQILAEVTCMSGKVSVAGFYVKGDPSIVSGISQPTIATGGAANNPWTGEPLPDPSDSGGALVAGGAWAHRHGYAAVDVPATPPALASMFPGFDFSLKHASDSLLPWQYLRYHDGAVIHAPLYAVGLGAPVNEYGAFRLEEVSREAVEELEVDVVTLRGDLATFMSKSTIVTYLSSLEASARSAGSVGEADDMATKIADVSALGDDGVSSLLLNKPWLVPSQPLQKSVMYDDAVENDVNLLDEVMIPADDGRPAVTWRQASNAAGGSRNVVAYWTGTEMDEFYEVGDSLRWDVSIEPKLVRGGVDVEVDYWTRDVWLAFTASGATWTYDAGVTESSVLAGLGYANIDAAKTAGAAIMAIAHPADSKYEMQPQKIAGVHPRIHLLADDSKHRLATFLGAAKMEDLGRLPLTFQGMSMRVVKAR